MPHILPENVPWYVVGPLMALLVTAMFALTNQPIGASGSYAQVTDRILGKPMKEPWRIPFMGGVILGGIVAAVLRGDGFAGWSYGQLGQLVSPGVLIVILLVGGIMMGYGARWMGGCTSGHGLCGTASRSPGSFAATGTFFVVAVGVTYILHIATGGVL
jgi:uncharacterized protein